MIVGNAFAWDRGIIHSTTQDGKCVCRQSDLCGSVTNAGKSCMTLSSGFLLGNISVTNWLFAGLTTFLFFFKESLLTWKESSLSIINAFDVTERRLQATKRCFDYKEDIQVEKVMLFNHWNLSNACLLLFEKSFITILLFFYSSDFVWSEMTCKMQFCFSRSKE